MPHRKPSTQIDASDILAALRSRMKNQSGQWVVMPEVRNATGAAARIRSADALAMNLWPSAGLEIHGFEFKISRADLVKELTDPAKAQALKRFCSRWWLCLSRESLIKSGELPDDWGLLVLRGSRLCCKKAAPPLNPDDLTRNFFASLLRSACRASPANGELKRVREEGRQEGLKERESDISHFERQAVSVAERLAEYEKQIGERINLHTIPNLRERLELVRRLDPKLIVRRVEHLRDELNEALENYERAGNGEV